MNDLISRSALLEEFGEEPFVWDSRDREEVQMHNDWLDYTKLVKEAPAVDAVVLPCKVGDPVWGIRNYKGINHPQQGKVDQMYYTNDMRLHIKIKHICIGEWGKKIFLTREEAEAALKKRKEADDD